MSRNLDLAALRALVAVLDLGGVTRAAGHLNLTQSAVSLQIKRLEEMLDTCLLERSGRGVAATHDGEQLALHATRLLAMNDEIVDRFGPPRAPLGDVRLGVPCDLLRYHVPTAIRRFTAAHPAARVMVRTEGSAALRALCASGALDVILTTEAEPHPGGEVMARMPLVWVGAPDGEAWRRAPLPFAAVTGCAFTQAATERLTGTATAWTVATEASMIESVVFADIAVYAMLRGAIAPGLVEIDHGGALPALPDFSVVLHVTAGPRRAIGERFADSLRDAIRLPAAA